MQQQPAPQEVDAATMPATATEEMPMACPRSHRVARKLSMTIIAVLVVLVLVTVGYVLFSGAR